MPDVIHVVAENELTFTGLEKGLVYPQHEARFARWADRIRYVSGRGDADGPFTRQFRCRELIWEALQDARPDDVLVHGDADEIVLAGAVAQLERVQSPLRFSARCALFAVDWEAPWPWTGGPVVTTVGDFRARSGLWTYPFQTLRDGWLTGGQAGWPVGLTGAWHLSWLGGPEAIRRKASWFAHADQAPWIAERAEACYERGVFWGEPDEWFAQRDVQLIAAEVDESWPRWVFERKCPQAWFRPREDDELRRVKLPAVDEAEDAW